MNEPQLKRKSFLSDNILWIVAVVVIMVIYSCSDSAPKKKIKRWAVSEKVLLCKAYIADQFGRPLNTIKLQRVDSKDLIYISYIRNFDNTQWDYVCEMDGSTMTWAGWVDGGWGRWRTEDEVLVSYDEQANTAFFESIRSSTDVQVNL